MEKDICPKEVAVYIGASNSVADEDELTIFDVFFEQDPDEKPVCSACPRRVLRAGAFICEDLKVVNGSIKADPGSEKNGLKKMDGQPTCFHTGRARALNQA